MAGIKRINLRKLSNVNSTQNSNLFLSVRSTMFDHTPMLRERFIAIRTDKRLERDVQISKLSEKKILRSSYLFVVVTPQMSLKDVMLEEGLRADVARVRLRIDIVPFTVYLTL